MPGRSFLFGREKDATVKRGKVTERIHRQGSASGRHPHDPAQGCSLIGDDVEIAIRPLPYVADAGEAVEQLKLAPEDIARLSDDGVIGVAE